MDKKLIGAVALMLLLGAGCATTGTIDTAGNTGDNQSDETADINAAEQEANDNDADDNAASGTVEAGTDVDLNSDLIGGDAQAGADVNAEANVKDFTVEGENYTFSPSTMTVKKGDTVRITFKNMEGFHDFKIDEYDIATKQIAAGAQETVEFVADKAGSFEYYCSVGSHRAMGMKGTLTVTE